MAPGAKPVVLLAAVSDTVQAGAVRAGEIDLTVHAAARRHGNRQPRPFRGPEHAGNRVVEGREQRGPATLRRDDPSLRDAVKV